MEEFQHYKSEAEANQQQDTQQGCNPADSDHLEPKASDTADSDHLEPTASDTAEEVAEQTTQLEEEEPAPPVEEVTPVSSSRSALISSSPSEGIKSMKIKGNIIPVDEVCIQKFGKAQVYVDGDDVYNVVLHQTNISNNNNKYYRLQLLVDYGNPQYSVWCRWDRVGYTRYNKLIEYGPNLDEAKKTYMKKFSDKTNNDWNCRDSFEKCTRKYDMLEMDYTVNKGKDEADSSKVKQELDKSKLDKRIQDVITLICNEDNMTKAVVEMEYDATKAPLGNLTADQIKAGYAALKDIEECIDDRVDDIQLSEACDIFYTKIPHSFRMTRPPLIRTNEDLKAKIKLLDILGDIQIALTVLKEGLNSDEHPIDNKYHSLKCKINPLEKENSDYKIVEQYLLGTHAKTHSDYTLQVMDVFEIEKEHEKERFKDVGNRMLLWHGSLLINFAGILGKGLRIAPPEAPFTGCMFGKGVYFADRSSKSANYCFAKNGSNVAFILLCEVALGTPNELLAADCNADKLPNGKNSVKGLGKWAPEAKSNHTLSDGTIVPLGVGKDTGVVNPSGYTLNYNEYIVYNTNQVKMKYLVKLKKIPEK